MHGWAPRRKGALLQSTRSVASHLQAAIDPHQDCRVQRSPQAPDHEVVKLQP
jgi:hypothetical protein